MSDEDRKLSEKDFEEKYRDIALAPYRRARLEAKRKREEKEAKEQKKAEFKKQIEETAQKVENLSMEKWIEFDTKYMVPIRETLEYCKQSLSDLAKREQELKEYTYHESYERRLLNAIRDQLHKEFKPKFEELEKEKIDLISLLDSIEDVFESLTKLVTKRLGKKLEE